MKGRPAAGRSKQARRPSRRRAGNLVVEIVDQITEKQDRAARGPGHPDPAGAADLSSGDSASPYRFIMKCGGPGPAA